MLLACRRVRKQLLPPGHVVRKTTTGKYDAFACEHTDSLAFPLDDRASYGAVFNNQLFRWRGKPQRNAEIEGRLGKAPGKRVTVGQQHAASVAEDLEEVLRKTLTNVNRGLHGPRRPHEMHDLLARTQHHAEHGQFRKRRAEVLYVVAEFAPIERTGHH